VYNEIYLLTEDGGNKYSRSVRPHSPTITEEQNLIKERLKEALGNSDDGSDSEMWGGLFQKRHKTQAEVVCIVLYGSFHVK
jgi:hypothetical protein